MPRLDSSLYDYTRVTKFKPITNWEDIKEGELYHIPPTILYDRRDFICNFKTDNTLKGKVKCYEKGIWEDCTLYRSEISMRFLVKKEKINNY